ncbi:MAG TPA: hypothetical protein PLM53_01845 [Spirochaetota bacterium]|nr:hypothetical protein [Spirochaetota bacterium]HPC41155.1 hypothetical protein [Spirochaetota bacterium]HPL19048.1 hypothetical protein [Spirochaetota bacterium]HQF07075.1 hypothetical protein [Spirochaetota bacterium]HQH95812.1 hypothetical protein [Spirochaetota bacterium]
MTSSRHATSGAAAAALLLLSCGELLANGYNRISELAVPALFILFGLAYGVIALVPAALVNLVVKKAARGYSPGFMRSYSGSLIGGEIGTAMSFAIHRMSGPGWNSYHYTLYPYLVLGLSLAAAALFSLIRARK